MMANTLVEQVADLVTSVDGLTETINVRKQVLDDAVAGAASSAATGQTAAALASGVAAALSRGYKRFSTLADLNAAISGGNLVADDYVAVDLDPTAGNNGTYAVIGTPLAAVKKSGPLVDTTDTQTLINKSLTSPTVTTGKFVDGMYLTGPGNHYHGYRFNDDLTDRFRQVVQGQLDNPFGNALTLLAHGDGQTIPDRQTSILYASGEAVWPWRKSTTYERNSQDLAQYRLHANPYGSLAQDHTPVSVGNGYHVGAGDWVHPLLVTQADVTLCLEHFTGGDPTRIISLGQPIRLDAGEGREWQGFAPGTRFITVPAGAIVEPFNLNGTTLACSTFLGPAPNVSASQVENIYAHMIVLSGQSLAFRFCVGAGPEGFQRELKFRGFGESVRLVNVGRTASSLMEQAPTQSSWWLNDNGTAGPLLVEAFERIDGLIDDGQPAPQRWLWDQGYQEFAHSFTDPEYASFAGYRDALIQLGALVAAKYPGCKLWVTPLGSLDAVALNVPGPWQMIRRAQLAAIAASSNLLHGVDIYDLPRPLDDPHLSFESFREYGRRLAWHVINDLGGGSLPLGPTIASVDSDIGTYGTYVDVTLENAQSLIAQPLPEGWPDMAVVSADTPTAAQTVYRPRRTVFGVSEGAFHIGLYFDEVLPANHVVCYPYGNTTSSGRVIFDRVPRLPMRSQAVQNTV